MSKPSVTQIISSLLPIYADIPPEVLAKAAKRGTALHELCFKLLVGDFVAVKPDYEPYVMCFEKWIPHVEEVILVEKALETDQFVGHPDLVVRMQGKNVLVDLKTTAQKQMVSWKLQLAGYWVLCEANNIKIDRAGCLWINKSKTVPEFVELRDVNKWKKLFLSCVDVYYLQKYI